MKKYLFGSALLLLIILFFSTTVLAATIQLPKTGQTTCYNWQTPWEEIDCDGTGQDGEYQKGAVWPEPRFDITYCAASSPCLNPALDCDGDSTNDVVTDTLTGLMWTRDGNLPNGTHTWNDSIDFANNLGLCGHDDWRLPNINELESLVNAGATLPAVWLTNHGFTNVQPNVYWSSTTQAAHTAGAWTVYLWAGILDASNKINADASVWPVRGHSLSPAQLWQTGQNASYREGDDGDLKQGVASPSLRFNVNGDCVIDNLTGLMWTQDANLSGYTTWGQALNYSNSLTLCGYDDWRLPNSKELLSLIDRSWFGPALPTGHPFGNVQTNSSYWSSSNHALADKSYARAISILDGTIHYASKETSGSIAVWPVRAGGGTFGTIGTQVTLTGSGFGEKQGKVLIGNVASKKTKALKIAKDGWHDDQIICTVTKLPEGPYTAPFDVTIITKSKPPLSITLKNAFTVKPPEIDSLNSYEGAANDPITITGNFFSTKKGKVYLEVPGGKPKSCKVTSWGVDSITFAVPKTSKSFPSGTYPLKVTNKVGQASTSPDFTVLEPGP